MNAGAIGIRPGGLDDPRVVALLAVHVARARAESPPCSAHAMARDALRGPDVRFWSAWDGETLLGFGALKTVDKNQGEVKSMHVAEAARGRGVGRALLATIEAAARDLGWGRLSLETGSMAYFEPARRLYARAGFEACGPFGAYRVDPNTLFMTKTLG